MRDRTPVPSGSKLLKDFAIHICKVNLETGRCLTAPQLIRSSSSGVAEGSHIIKRKKYYYLFTAEGGTESGHSEYVSRNSVGPFGPWELGSKIVSSGTGADDEVQNTGHCDLVEDEQGRWWAVLLAVRPLKTADGSWEPSVFGWQPHSTAWSSTNCYPRPGDISDLRSMGERLASVQQRRAYPDFWQSSWSLQTRARSALAR